MAKKGKGKKGKGKKSTKKYGGKKKGRAAPRQKKHLGAMLGTAKSAYDMETDLAWAGMPLYQLQKEAILAILRGDFETTRIKDSVTQTGRLAVANSAPALIGVSISYGEDIPLVGDLVREVKRPLNKLLGKIERKLTKRKRRWWL